ncbi:MAG: hypothetical protein QF535_07990 [Anaerolineales bacterium]|jgi:hypothetical protein|nr:hypothetical protein [Anaerolineales bacterium]
MSTLNVDKVDPSTGTALEIGSSGDTVSIPSGATLDISSATLTPPATLPASSGVNLTALNASNLGSGTVPTARLGTGTASSSTVLYGDNTWAAAGGGKIIAHAFGSFVTETSTNANSAAAGVAGAVATLTTVNANAKIMIINQVSWQHVTNNAGMCTLMYSVDGGTDTLAFTGNETATGSDAHQGIRWGYNYVPFTDQYVNYEVHSNTAGQTIAYKQFFWTYSTTATTVYINRCATSGSYAPQQSVCTMTLFEID